MTLKEQVLAQAVLLSGGVEDGQLPMLELLCQAAVTSISHRLRPGLTPDDCRADFVAAAALTALSGMHQVSEDNVLESVQAGDVVLRRRSGDVAANCLRNQAELMIAPYLQDRFSFLGV